MFNNLQVESKLDIFKYLNIEQLTSVRQTNNYFNALIGRYEGELAREKLYSIEIVELCEGYNYKFISLQDGVFKLKITDQLMEKWNSAVDRQIPFYLNNDKNQIVIRIYLGPVYGSLNLPTIPKSIEEIKIIRCWIEKISRCYFTEFNFISSVINPELIQLIFDNEEINKIKFNCHKCWDLYIYDETTLLFYLNRLVIDDLFLVNLCNDNTFNQQSIDILFKFLLKIPTVFIGNSKDSTFCKIILNHIET
ncbi:hypothetical protein ACQ4LE_006869 [Meloidogyne hapla]